MKKIKLISNNEIWKDAFLAYVRIIDCRFYFYCQDYSNIDFDAVLIDADGLTNKQIQRYVQTSQQYPSFLITNKKNININVSGVFSDDMPIRNMLAAISLFFSNEVNSSNYIIKTSIKEKSVLSFLSQGLSNKSIARKSGLSEDLVKYYLRRIYKKLNVHNRHQAISKIQDIDL